MSAIATAGSTRIIGEGQGTPEAALDRFSAVAGGLERAAAAIARLDALLAGHPLLGAWVWRSRLDAVRRQAASDGLLIDPWHLAALLEGLRFRMDYGTAISERGAVFDAARHAFSLWRWFVHPDETQTAAIAEATAALAAHPGVSPLLAVVRAMRGWLDQGGDRPPLRAALALYWQDRGLMPVAAPLLTGAAAFSGTAPRQSDAWTVHFLTALAEEAEAGTALLRLLERQWFAARAAIGGRRRDSHAAAAIDVMAAAPIVSATSLAASLGIAVKNATALLAGFAARGIAIEVTHRSKRRLYGLKHLAPLRAEAALPRRAQRRPRGDAGSPAGVLPALPDTVAEAGSPAAAVPLVLSPLKRQEFDLSDLDAWMREAEQVIRRTQTVLERFAAPPQPAARRSRSM